MTFEQIIEAIKNLGVPVGILGYILWRGDNFLSRLINKMDQFNASLSHITLLIQDLINHSKK